MLWYEDVVDKVQHLVSTDAIVDGLSYVIHFNTTSPRSFPPSSLPISLHFPKSKSLVCFTLSHSFSERESNMDSIQQQLDFVMVRAFACSHSVATNGSSAGG